MLLEMRDVTVRFGGLVAVDRFDIEIEEGQVVSLIGPNGAGKSTVFNAVTGIYPPNSGKIVFRGTDITRMKPHKITSLGIARTFQNIRLFKGLSVFDNVRIGCHSRGKAGFLSAVGRLPSVKREEKEIKERAIEALDLVGLLAKKDDKASSLSYGEQRRLEIARAVASTPVLLLLDEPAAGMNPQEKMDLMRLLERIRASGITILLVEHDMKFVMSISHRVDVLDHGQKIASGTPEQVQKDPAVIAAYLGEEAV